MDGKEDDDMKSLVETLTLASAENEAFVEELTHALFVCELVALEHADAVAVNVSHAVATLVCDTMLDTDSDIVALLLVELVSVFPVDIEGAEDTLNTPLADA